MTQEEAQKKINNILESNLYTKIELAKLMGMSFPTFKKRNDAGNWNHKEITKINFL